MDDPLIEAENKDERLIRVIKRAEADELARERFKADIEFSRKPWWVQAAEEGDYMADGSDHQPWDNEEER